MFDGGRKAPDRLPSEQGVRLVNGKLKQARFVNIAGDRLVLPASRPVLEDFVDECGDGSIGFMVRSEIKSAAKLRV